MEQGLTYTAAARPTAPDITVCASCHRGSECRSLCEGKKFSKKFARGPVSFLEPTTKPDYEKPRLSSPDPRDGPVCQSRCPPSRRPVGFLDANVFHHAGRPQQRDL